jgi:hypothetical protein
MTHRLVKAPRGKHIGKRIGEAAKSFVAAEDGGKDVFVHISVVKKRKWQICPRTSEF